MMLPLMKSIGHTQRRVKTNNRLWEQKSQLFYKGMHIKAKIS